jgi:hypothetical protein
MTTIAIHILVSREKKGGDMKEYFDDEKPNLL